MQSRGLCTLVLVLVATACHAQVSGQVLEQFDGNFIFRPDDLTLESVPLDNRDLGTRLNMLPRVTVPTLERINEPAAASAEAQLPSVSRFRELEGSLASSNFDAVKRAFGDLELQVNESLSLENAQVGDTEAIYETAVSAVAEISMAALRELRTPLGSCEGISTLQQLAERLEAEIRGLDPQPEEFADLRPIEKAIYADGREYLPDVYRRIAMNTQGTVGIGDTRAGDELHCSGAVIGDDLVLTARHCLFTVVAGVAVPIPEARLRVAFDFEAGMERQDLKVAEVVVIGETDSTGTDRLDYAILKVEDAPGPSIFWRVFGAQGLPDPKRQICLSTATVTRDDDVYVIGHPKRLSRRVADNGKVLFPFLVSEELLGKLHLEVMAELMRDTTNRNADLTTICEQLKRWSASYEDRGDGLFRHNSRAFHGQPTLGIQSNTFGGNSGGPVFSKSYNRIIGVFRAGEFDGTEVLEGGWDKHEGALPIELVVEDMTARDPDWMTEHNVCVWGKGDDDRTLWSDDGNLQAHCARVCE